VFFGKGKGEIVEATFPRVRKGYLRNSMDGSHQLIVFSNATLTPLQLTRMDSFAYGAVGR
jgi:hypothetical protein